MYFLMGVDQKIQFDFIWDLNTHCYLKDQAGFFTTTKAGLSKYVEFTPYFKGNLFKIRLFAEGHYKVYFGTKELSYCTSLRDCFELINESQ